MENKPAQCGSGHTGTAPGQSQPFPRLKWCQVNPRCWSSNPDSSIPWSAGARTAAGGCCSVQRGCPVVTPAQHHKRLTIAARGGFSLFVSIANRTGGKVASKYWDCAMRNRRSNPNSVTSPFQFHLPESIITTQRQDIPSLWGCQGFSGGKKFLSK